MPDPDATPWDDSAPWVDALPWGVDTVTTGGITSLELWDPETGTLTPLTDFTLYDSTTHAQTPFPITELNSDPTIDPGGGGGGGGGGTTGTMLYGVSGTNTGNGFAAGYNKQVTDIHVKGGYSYGHGSSYSSVSGMPTTHRLMFQTKIGIDESPALTLAQCDTQYRAMVATFPATRPADIRISLDNEVDRKIKLGNYNMAYWQARMNLLIAAIADSGKSYLKPGLEIQYGALQAFNKGSTLAYNQIDDYLLPGIVHVGWSGYADATTDSTGHSKFVHDPVQMPKALQTYMAKHPTVDWSLITGWALSPALMSDSISTDRRAAWTTTLGSEMMKTTAQELLWFDLNYTNGNYLIEPPNGDPKLFTAWKDLLTTSGQW